MRLEEISWRSSQELKGVQRNEPNHVEFNEWTMSYAPRSCFLISVQIDFHVRLVTWCEFDEKGYFSHSVRTKIVEISAVGTSHGAQHNEYRPSQAGHCHHLQ